MYSHQLTTSTPHLIQCWRWWCSIVMQLPMYICTSIVLYVCIIIIYVTITHLLHFLHTTYPPSPSPTPLHFPSLTSTHPHNVLKYLCDISTVMHFHVAAAWGRYPRVCRCILIASLLLTYMLLCICIYTTRRYILYFHIPKGYTPCKYPPRSKGWIYVVKEDTQAIVWILRMLRHISCVLLVVLSPRHHFPHTMRAYISKRHPALPSAMQSG